MRRLALVLPLLALALPAAAASKPQREASPAQRAQHEKMRQCNASAREQALHGGPRKDFMKQCLSGRSAG